MLKLFAPDYDDPDSSRYRSECDQAVSDDQSSFHGGPRQKGGLYPALGSQRVDDKWFGLGAPNEDFALAAARPIAGHH